MLTLGPPAYMNFVVSDTFPRASSTTTISSIGSVVSLSVESRYGSKV